MFQRAGPQILRTDKNILFDVCSKRGATPRCMAAPRMRIMGFGPGRGNNDPYEIERFAARPENSGVRQSPVHFVLNQKVFAKL